MCRWNRVLFPLPPPSPASGPRSDAPIAPSDDRWRAACSSRAAAAGDGPTKGRPSEGRLRRRRRPADARHKEASFARGGGRGGGRSGGGGGRAPSSLGHVRERRRGRAERVGFRGATATVCGGGDELEWGAFATRAGLFTGLPGFGGGGGGGAAAAAAPAAEPPSLASKIWGFDLANGARAPGGGAKKSGEDGLFEKGTVGFEQGVGGGGGGGAVGFKEASFARRGTLRSPEVPPGRRRRRRQQPAQGAFVRTAPRDGRTDRAQLHAPRHHRSAEAEG